MKRAKTFKSYLELVKEGERALIRSCREYKGDPSGLTAFVRAEIERTWREMGR